MVMETNFTDNQLYTDPSFPAFGWRSAQTVLQIFVALQIGMAAALATFAFGQAKLYFWAAVFLAAAAGAATTAVVVTAARKYVSARGQLPADQGIHGRTKMT
jgi:hypothetical protein